MELSWPTLRELEALHGESFYLLDLERFESNYLRFLASFQAIYPNTQIGYSYKTNYTPRLCQSVDRLGGYAEVVSGMEFDIAQRIGVDGGRIIFNGPYKRAVDLERAFLLGALVNVDSHSEVSIIETLAEKHPSVTFRIGLRCNVNLDGEKISRFGFDTCRDTIHEVFRSLRRHSNCRVEGLHCHLMTPTRSPADYEVITSRMLQLAWRYFEEARPAFIDVGGGFFSPMGDEFRRQFPFSVPGFAEYAAAVASQLRDAYPADHGPELILEPGLALVADAMQFVTKVIDIKQVCSRWIGLVSGSVYNIKPTLSATKLPITVFRQPFADEASGQPYADETPIDFVGYTCMENDCLYPRFTGGVAVGDYVVFEHAGAYTNVLKPPFINPSPPILSCGPTPGTCEILRRREESSDVLSTYMF